MDAPKTRRKPGPKTEAHVEGTMKPVQLTLDEKTLRMLNVAGGGNLSRGVRASARHWYADYQRDKVQPEGVTGSSSAPSA